MIDRPILLLGLLVATWSVLRAAQPISTEAKNGYRRGLMVCAALSVIIELLARYHGHA